MAVKSENPKCWSIVICGDLPEPFVVFVPDPHRFTVSQLKEEIEKKIVIPANEETVYCQETPLSDGMILDECQGIDIWCWFMSFKKRVCNKYISSHY